MVRECFGLCNSTLSLGWMSEAFSSPAGTHIHRLACMIVGSYVCVRARTPPHTYTYSSMSTLLCTHCFSSSPSPSLSFFSLRYLSRSLVGLHKSVAKTELTFLEDPVKGRRQEDTCLLGGRNCSKGSTLALGEHSKCVRLCMSACVLSYRAIAVASAPPSSPKSNP